MNSEVIITIVLAMLGSAGLFSFIQFLINRKDKKHDDIKGLKEELQAVTKVLREERDKQTDLLQHELVAEIKEVKEELNQCIDNQTKLQLDTTRLQMLVLMKHFPDDSHRLMEVAQKYFDEQNGNWYMGSLFAEYCDKHNIPKPDWFKEN